MTVVAPILIGVAYVLLNSLIREPHRRRFNAIMVAGAWELALWCLAGGPSVRAAASSPAR